MIWIRCGGPKGILKALWGEYKRPAGVLPAGLNRIGASPHQLLAPDVGRQSRRTRIGVRRLLSRELPPYDGLFLCAKGALLSLHGEEPDQAEGH